MRVCSDRPFFYYELALKMKKTFEKGNFDIVTNVFPKSIQIIQTIKLRVLNDKKQVKNR